MTKRLLLMLTCGLMLACGGGDDAGGGGGSDYLNVNNDRSTLSIPSANTTTTLVINASKGCEWEIVWDRSIASWIKSITPENGRGSTNVSISTVNTNTSLEDRSVALTIRNTNGNISPRTIMLVHEASTEILSLREDKSTIPGDGGNIVITVTCNTDWQAMSSESWSSLDKQYGNGNGEIKVSVQKSLEISARESVITVSTAKNTATITIKQEARTTPLDNDNTTPNTPK